MSKRVKFVDLSVLKDIDIKSVEVRETDANDLIRAAERCSAPGAKLDENVFSLMLRQEMISGAITRVDGQEVRGVCRDYKSWNARTRGFVGRIYDYLNGNREADDAVFEKLLTGETASSQQQSAPVSSAPASSVSGSESQPSSSPVLPSRTGSNSATSIAE